MHRTPTIPSIAAIEWLPFCSFGFSDKHGVYGGLASFWIMEGIIDTTHALYCIRFLHIPFALFFFSSNCILSYFPFHLFAISTVQHSTRASRYAILVDRDRKTSQAPTKMHLHSGVWSYRRIIKRIER